MNRKEQKKLAKKERKQKAREEKAGYIQEIDRFNSKSKQKKEDDRIKKRKDKKELADLKNQRKSDKSKFVDKGGLFKTPKPEPAKNALQIFLEETKGDKAEKMDKWKSKSAKEKEKWRKKSKQDRDRFKREMKQWNDLDNKIKQSHGGKKEKRRK